MISGSPNDDFKPGLHMVWWDPPSDDTRGVGWGQLAGAVNRLGIVLDGLDGAARRRDAAKGFSELTFYLENYFVRVYELRERAIALVESLLGAKVGAAKNPKHREAVLLKLPPAAADIRGPLIALLQLLDADIEIRNDQTHKQFIDLQLVVSPSDMYEPDTVLLETQRSPAGTLVRRIIRRETRRLAVEYAEKALLVRQATSALLEVAHVRIMRSVQHGPPLV